MKIARRELVFLGILSCSLCLHAETLTPSDVNVAGAIDYGQTSSEMQYTGHPRYSALVFNGESGDQLEVTIKSVRKAQVAIADGSLNVLFNGTGRLAFTLPNRGADPEAYYILFRDADGQAGQFTVELQKVRSKTATKEGDSNHD